MIAGGCFCSLHSGTDAIRYVHGLNPVGIVPSALIYVIPKWDFTIDDGYRYILVDLPSYDALRGGKVRSHVKFLLLVICYS